MDRIAILKGAAIFDGLSENELKMLADCCTEHSYPMGTVIIKENDAPKKTLYLVRSGEVAISTSAVTAEGDGHSDDSLITTLGEGEVFGEVSLIDNYPHSATVRAISDATLMLLPSAQFFKVVECDVNVGYIVMRNIARILAQRLRDTNMTIHFGLIGEG